VTDFFSSEAGQFAGLAKAFLEGARVLDAAQPEIGRILFPPTLALAGHGLELILKACFFINGCEPTRRGNKGHRIELLWKAEICEPLRGAVYANARVVAEIDRSNSQYRGVPDDDNVLELIEEYVLELCNLHGENGYPLRYPAEQGREAPRTPFLVKSLWRTADDLVKRPREFELVSFSGLA